LRECNVAKESTIQFLVNRGAAGEAPAKPVSTMEERPSLLRQRTVPEMAFGDLLLVKLVRGSNLIPMDIDEGYDSSDPYATFVLGDQLAYSSVKEKTLEPYWDEVICFCVQC
jgi:hypothetical protein